jgi:hypothetical protein
MSDMRRRQFWLAFKGFIVHFSIIPRRRSPGPSRGSVRNFVREWVWEPQLIRSSEA